MSEKFIVVNHDRSEYFRPTAFGESGKLGGVIDGRITTLAVSLLAVLSTQVKPHGKIALIRIPLFGAWNSSNLELVGEYNDRYEDLATRYRDISFAVISLLSHASENAIDHFVKMFGEANLATVEVGSAIFAEHCEPLRAAIEKEYGAEWQKLFKQASSKCSHSAHPPSK